MVQKTRYSTAANLIAKASPEITEKRMHKSRKKRLSTLRKKENRTRHSYSERAEETLTGSAQELAGLSAAHHVDPPLVLLLHQLSGDVV